MQIHQQGRTPPIPQGLKRARKRGVIGAVHILDPRCQLSKRHSPAPQFAHARQTSRDEPEPAARAASGSMARQIGRRAFGNHLPIHILP